MILRRADEISASATTASACPILSLFLEQILVLLLVVENIEFCWGTAAAAMIVFWNFSKNMSVALYKCKGIRSLQVHRYWCEVWEGECI